MEADRREALINAIAEARSLCGCHQCQGGYDVGRRTLAAALRAPSDASALAGDITRPASCVAAVVLSELLSITPSETGGGE